MSCSLVVKMLTFIDKVDGVRLRLWSTATNGPIGHPPSDMWAWRNMVRWWWQRNTPDLSSWALWQFRQQNQLGASRRNGWKKWEFNHASISVHTCKDFFACTKILQHGASGFTSRLKEGVLWIFISHKNPSPQLSVNPRPLGPLESTLTTTPLRRLKMFI
jgi:hypothetical protein